MLHENENQIKTCEMSNKRMVEGLKNLPNEQISFLESYILKSKVTKEDAIRSFEIYNTIAGKKYFREKDASCGSCVNNVMSYLKTLMNELKS